MNLRIDTDLVRSGGTQVQQLADRLGSTMSSAESTLRTATENAGQPAIKAALEELLTTVTGLQPRVVEGLDVFAQEVKVAGQTFEETDAGLADAVPEAT